MLLEQFDTMKTRVAQRVECGNSWDVYKIEVVLPPESNTSLLASCIDDAFLCFFTFNRKVDGTQTVTFDRGMYYDRAPLHQCILMGKDLHRSACELLANMFQSELKKAEFSMNRTKFEGLNVIIDALRTPSKSVVHDLFVRP